MAINVSLVTDFKNITSNIPLEVILGQIKSGVYKSEIEKIRSLFNSYQPDEAEKLKKRLTAFTPAGTFKENRKNDHIDIYSSMVILDIDDQSNEKLNEMISELPKIDSVYSFFKSPSGNGLKIIFYVDSGPVDHQKAFEQLKVYFEMLFDIKVDSSGKDIARLCFVSYDPDLYLNSDTVPFKIQTETSLEYEAALIQAKLITERKSKYEKGNRNNFIHHLACNANRLGIPKEYLHKTLPAFYDLNKNELDRTIIGAYANNLQEHGKTHFGTNRIDKLEAMLLSRYDFRYNEVTQRIQCLDKESEEKEFLNLTDYLENSILRWLLKKGFNINQTLLRSILRSDFSKNFNPFIEYFKNLPEYDGKTDYISELANFVHTHHDELWHKVLKKWMVALVACATTKKVNQTAIIFAGQQGIGKTTFLINLIPPSLSFYIFSGTINPNNKDACIQLSECILINMDELETLNRVEIGSIKQLITEEVIRIRKAYGVNQESLTRRASFVGSVNSMQFLNDMTGSRRFLCFDVSSIDYKKEINYDGVFSQALHLLNTGFKYWFDGDEIDEITTNNEQFQIASHEEEALLNYFEPVLLNEAELFLTNTEIFSKLQSHSGLGNLRSRALGLALNKHGFIRLKRNGKQVYAIREKSLSEIINQNTTKE